MGLMEYDSKLDIGILSIDAHFDLHDVLHNDRGHSGSPFWQIAVDRKKRKLNFEYAVLGIQAMANNSFLFERAKELNTVIIRAAEWQSAREHANIKLDSFLQCQDAVFLTICLDSFNSAFAPGVSAPQPLGLYPDTVIPIIQKMAESKRVFAIEVVEVNPFYDVDQRTARLAASFIYEILHYFRPIE